MEWKVQDSYTSIRIVDDIISSFKEWTRSNLGLKCKVTLSLCEPTFWMTTEEQAKLQGSEGSLAIWPLISSELLLIPPPASPPDTRKVAEPKQVVVSITFRMANVHADKLKTHALILTKNPRGETLPPWNVQRLGTRVPYCCAVYKRPGFDEAYIAMKALKPELTELTFAKNEWSYNSGWDEQLVSLELFHGWTNCLKTFKAFEPIDTGDSEVTLSLLAPDVNANLDYITALLSAFN